MVRDGALTTTVAHGELVDTAEVDEQKIVAPRDPGIDARIAGFMPKLHDMAEGFERDSGEVIEVPALRDGGA